MTSANVTCSDPRECRDVCCERTCSAFDCPQPLVRIPGMEAARCTHDKDCERQCCEVS